MSTPYTISVVCTGNICRSPMGEVMLQDALDRAGVEGVRVISAGTGDWHVGSGADHRAEEIIARHGLDLSGHSAQQFTPRDFGAVDLVLALDDSHVRTLNRLARTENDREKIRLLRSFDPEALAEGDLDVNDPYYGDARDFEITYENIEAATPGIVEFVREQLAERA